MSGVLTLIQQHHRAPMVAPPARKHALGEVSPGPGSIVSVSYCGQGAVNLNSHYLGHSPDQELEVSLQSSQNGRHKTASGDNNVVMRGVGKASWYNTNCFKLRWTDLRQ